MRKTLLLICITNLFFVVAAGQPYKGMLEFSKLPVPPPHYLQEYTFDTTLNAEAWNIQKKGLHVSFASTDELYFRSEVPELEKEATTWQETGWKGERLNTQILVWSPDTLNQVRFSITDLKNESGRSIASNNFQVNMVRYVVSNYPYGIKDASCGASSYKN